MDIGTEIECPNCGKEMKIEDLIVTDDFYICPNCKFKGWIGDFTINKDQ